MKKNVLLTLAIVFSCALQIMAEPVTPDIAFLQAEMFLADKGVDVNNEDLTIINGPSIGNGEVAYYIVNNGDNGGFVIIAGDDKAEPILGYSEEGHFDLQNCGEGVSMLLQGYVTEMKSISEKAPATTEVEGQHRTKTPTMDAVQPMLTTKWGQRYPYFNSTPKNTQNQHCLVGCVPLAVGQMVYYHRARLSSKLLAAIPGYTLNGYKVNSVAKGTELNWNNMYDQYDGTQTSTQLKNVANLLLYVGAMLHAKYSITETQAAVNDIGTVCNTYFGFSTGEYRERANYTYSQWKDMIVNELVQDRPLLYYMGKTPTGGHLMVIDGYDGGDLFHINWGYEGMGNGYYTLSVLNPFDLGADDAAMYDGSTYMYKAKAFFGLQPLTGYHDVDLNTNLYALNNSLTKNSDGVSYSFSVTYTNKTANNGMFTCGIGYKDADENIQVLKEWSKGEVSLASNAGTGAIKYNISGSDFAAKKLTAKKYYKIVPISKIKGGDWEICEQNVTANTYAYCYYESSSKITASLKTVTASLSATFEFPGSHYKGSKQYVKAIVKNNGDDFTGNVYLFASNTSTKGSARSSFPVYIPGGKSVALYLYFTPKYAATYNIWLDTNSTGSNPFATTKLTTVDATATKKLAPGGLTVKHISSGKNVIGTTYEGSLIVKNNGSGTFSDIIRIQLAWCHPTTGKWVNLEREIVKFVEIPQGGSKTIEFRFDNLSPSNAYGLFYTYNDYSLWTSTSYAYNYKMSFGVMYYDQKGDIINTVQPSSTVTIPADAVTVDLTGTTQTVTKVVPNASTNTLYYVGGSDTKPSGLSGKNFVKGGKADNITLVANKPFYVLKPFTASKITFTLKPTIGAPKSGVGGWQTLVLPFAPTSITCDNVQLDWFRSKNDTKKHFWLKEFAAIEGASNVCFGYVNEFKANHPYLYAVPNSEWGANNNLVGKNIVFSANNALLHQNPVAVSASNAFNFRGTYEGETLSNIFTLDSKGTKFVKGKATVAPFTCYFVATTDDSTDLNSLNITSLDYNDETDIMMVTGEEEKTVDVYNVGGMKVATTVVRNGKVDLGNLPKGIYVVDGKKIVK